MTARPDGYYWVRCTGRRAAEIALWGSERWRLIGERVLLPDFACRVLAGPLPAPEETAKRPES